MAERNTTKHDIQRDEINSVTPNFSAVNRIIVSGTIGMLSTGADAGTDDAITVFADTAIPLINRTFTAGRFFLGIGFVYTATPSMVLGRIVHFTDNNVYFGLTSNITDNVVINDAGFTLVYEV